MEFWEKMALRYPLPFDKKTLASTQQVLSLVKSKGVELSQANVLDIACGTGVFTLPIACEAAAVTGLDSSQTMIKRMKEVISFENIQNVRPITAAWEDIDTSAPEFEKAFDIAWISMSPAVKMLEDFERMERCARKWCVYIGWGRKRKNTMMEEIYSLHGMEYGPHDGAPAAYDILTNFGRKASLDYFETSWSWTGTVEEVLQDTISFIEIHGGKAQHDLIKKTLARYEQNGLVQQTTEVEEGIIVWPIN
jgi:SAM-dependent methyltransferase